MKNLNSIKSSGSRLKHLALALVIGAGSAQAQFTNVGGNGVIGDTVLTTVLGTATTPKFSDWRVVGANGGTTSKLTSPAVAVTADGNVTLAFTHRYNFEKNYDGGALYISVDGGAATYVPLASFSSNGYSGTGEPNPANGSAWPGIDVFDSKSAGYDGSNLITSVADLGFLTNGQTISVEFRGAWDGASLSGPVAWEIGSFNLTDGAAAIIGDYDFDVDGASGFTTSEVGPGTPTPWAYTTVNWLDGSGNYFNTVRTGSSFSLSQSGQDVLINYNFVPIPEPRAALLGCLGLLALLRRRR